MLFKKNFSSNPDEFGILAAKRDSFFFKKFAIFNLSKPNKYILRACHSLQSFPYFGIYKHKSGEFGKRKVAILIRVTILVKDVKMKVFPPAFPFIEALLIESIIVTIN